ncbi:hypothetical protein K488DRAFT_49445, partial [Vararia minispora EC-137]
MDALPDFSLCEDLWFRDGNIVLVCDATGFRVNESVLSIHSAVFRDMLSVGTRAGTDAYEMCPIIRLSDDPLHMRLLLRMMYNRGYAHSFFDPSPAFILRGLLRVSSKYLVSHIRSEIISHLLVLFPTSIIEYRS